MAKSGVINELEKYLDEVKGKKSEELLFSYKGVLYPTGLCSAETFQALNTIEFRQDDVFLAAYPKCGECRFFGCKIKSKRDRCQICVILLKNAEKH